MNYNHCPRYPFDENKRYNLERTFLPRNRRCALTRKTGRLGYLFRRNWDARVQFFCLLLDLPAATLGYEEIITSAPVASGAPALIIRDACRVYFCVRVV